MSNNCCDTEIVLGGTIINPIITNPEITGGSITGGALLGGVTLDDATSTAIANQICSKLDSCMQGYINDGTFNNVTLHDASLMQGTLTSPTINGAVVLDQVARDTIATALCASLETCIIGTVSGSTLTDVTINGVNLSDAIVNNITLNGTIGLSDDTKDMLATKLAPALEGYLESWAQSLISAGLATITTDGILTNVTLKGTVLADAAATTALQSIVKPAIDSAIAAIVFPVISVNNMTGAVMLAAGDVGAIAAANGTGTDTILNTPTISQPTITSPDITGGSTTMTAHNFATLTGITDIHGDITADAEATAALCRIMEPCISSTVATVFDPSATAGVFQDCQGVPRSAGTRIPSCADMSAAIDNAIASLPALDVISGISYDADTHTLTIETILEPGGVPQYWTIDLSSLGGQVKVDNITIGGTGVVGDELHVIINEAAAPATSVGTELPTTLYGDRAALLGEPDKWIDIGGYLIPAFNKQP